MSASNPTLARMKAAAARLAPQLRQLADALLADDPGVRDLARRIGGEYLVLRRQHDEHPGSVVKLAVVRFENALADSAALAEAEGDDPADALGVDLVDRGLAHAAGFQVYTPPAD